MDQTPQPTALQAVDRRLARIEAALDRIVPFIDDVPPLLAMMVDTADEAAAQAAALGAPLDERLQAGLRLLDRASRVEVLERLTAVVESVGTDAEPSQLGLFGLLKATRDPDVRRALGWMIAAARALGAGLASTETEGSTS